MTRRGKIARLPKTVREELNVRIENGEAGAALAKWLNGLKPVKKILKECFEGQGIRVQNISEWRKGGFRDWQLNQETEAEVAALRESASGVAQVLDGEGIGN